MLHSRPHRSIYPAAAVLAVITLSACSANRPNGYPYRIESSHAVSSPDFVRSVDALLLRPLVGGNAVTTLVNGDEIFPAMLSAISAAQETITFETFVYWSGDIADRFAEALRERARSGVAVHVLIDAVGGAPMSGELIDSMRQDGVDVRMYGPVDIADPESLMEVNYRTHRKILVADGRIGFIGGVGISEEWTGNAHTPDEWRDNHYRVEGPVVAQLQSAFFDNWVDTTGNVLFGESYYPPLEPAGDLLTQVVASSSDTDGAKIQLMLLLCLAGAREEVLLATPYFVPDDSIVRELLNARERGVPVRILVPGEEIDTSVVRLASRARWGELLEAGVEIWEFQPTMFHCKTIIIDNIWTSIGSANLDNRSFFLNDEANLNVLDVGFAAEQKAVFEADLARAKRVTKIEYERRGFFERLWGGFASLFRKQL